MRELSHNLAKTCLGVLTGTDDALEPRLLMRQQADLPGQRFGNKRHAAQAAEPHA